MSLKSAFNVILRKQTRPMQIVRLGSPDVTADILAAPSNYSRNLMGPSEMVMEGKEFVISKDILVAPFIPPKRGDRLKDTDMGTMTISEVRELFDLGARIIGYRVRVG